MSEHGKNDTLWKGGKVETLSGTITQKCVGGKNKTNMVPKDLGMCYVTLPNYS